MFRFGCKDSVTHVIPGRKADLHIFFSSGNREHDTDGKRKGIMFPCRKAESVRNVSQEEERRGRQQQKKLPRESNSFRH